MRNCVFERLIGDRVYDEPPTPTSGNDLRQSHSGQVKDPFVASCQIMDKSGLNACDGGPSDGG